MCVGTVRALSHRLVDKSIPLNLIAPVAIRLSPHGTHSSRTRAINNLPRRAASATFFSSTFLERAFSFSGRVRDVTRRRTKMLVRDATHRRTTRTENEKRHGDDDDDGNNSNDSSTPFKKRLLGRWPQVALTSARESERITNLLIDQSSSHAENLTDGDRAATRSRPTTLSNAGTKQNGC